MKLRINNYKEKESSILTNAYLLPAHWKQVIILHWNNLIVFHKFPSISQYMHSYLLSQMKKDLSTTNCMRSQLIQRSSLSILSSYISVTTKTQLLFLLTIWVYTSQLWWSRKLINWISRCSITSHTNLITILLSHAYLKSRIITRDKS